MKKIILILILVLFNLLAARQNPGESEKQLDQAQGKEKIEILLDLAAQPSETYLNKAAEYGRQALSLPERYADEKSEKEKRHKTRVNFYFLAFFFISVIVAVGLLRYLFKRRAEKAIRESEHIYRELVERANDGITIIQDGLIKFVNPEITNMFGYSDEEIIEKTFIDVIWPQERKRIADINRRRIAGEEVENKYETVLLHRDGHKVYVEINAGLITYDNRPATLAFVHNAGERRLLEEERIKRSKLEAVGSLAAGIAHDFNNLLAVILGNIELAKIFPKSEEKMSAIFVKIEKSALKARDLTKRFLTFSEGSAPFKKLVPLQPIINEALDVTVTRADIRYKLNIPAELWEVNCDEELVYQVFSSLISNAAESMERGGVIGIGAENVEITTQAEPLLPGKYVKITVKDEGEGIKEEHLPKIFDPYFSTRRRVSQKGLGFGLSIVYSIIKQHAGHIEVESEVDKGTTVTIYLPLK
ncbi:MAG: PAS domain S-box protein [Candidatus Aminicenantes bacterium]|nr:PAS domain S-box protein [Candidatus Aminicenantes bacterium]